MNSIKVNLFLLLLIFGFSLQSCQQEEEELSNVEIDEFRRGDYGNGNGDPGQGSNDHISELENDLVYDWTQLILEIERYSTGARPNAIARAYAYINLASYETAVPAMRDYNSLDKKLEGLRINRNNRARDIDFELALNASFAKTIDHFIINIPNAERDKIEALAQAKEDQLSVGLSTKQISESKDWGNYVAEQVILYSQTDLAAEEQILDPQPLSYVPPTGDGFWTFSADPERALFPYWGSVRTFVIPPEETNTLDPLSYSEDPTSPYYLQMKEVLDVNDAAKAQNNDDLHIAEFWSDDGEGITFSPPSRQYSISNQLIKQFDLDLEETLVLYLKLGFALNDAAVSTWKYKYDHMVMRPNVYIKEFMDPDFQTNLFRLVYWPNPSFPGYPSGHSCFATAAAGVFIDQFGNNFEFTDRSHEGRTEFRGAPRTYSSMQELARENAFSRIPLGVHVRMDCTEGHRLGYEISDAINKLRLRRNHG